PALLAGVAPSAIVVDGNDREVTASRVDGHSITAEDVVNSSRCGGAH
ncbi:hypothetical protein N322_11325, partial [Cariama cristata]